jgi:hypothetical protein
MEVADSPTTIYLQQYSSRITATFHPTPSLLPRTGNRNKAHRSNSPENVDSPLTKGERLQAETIMNVMTAIGSINPIIALIVRSLKRLPGHICGT